MAVSFIGGGNWRKPLTYRKSLRISIFMYSLYKLFYRLAAKLLQLMCQDYASREMVMVHDGIPILLRYVWKNMIKTVIRVTVIGVYNLFSSIWSVTVVLIRPPLLPRKSGLIKWMTALDRDSILLFQSGLSIRGGTWYFYLPKKCFIRY